MNCSHEALHRLLDRPAFPRSAKYEPEWVVANQMGPNALWLTEWLCEAMALAPGMRVLDLGCGRALSSIFLASEFGVAVWATDLWIGATDNAARIREAHLEDQVFPIHADARSLPYAHDFFDAIVCVDAYIYFGTDDLYLKGLHRFVKPGGQLGIAQPALTQELPPVLPAYLVPFWGDDCWSWHTLAWWQHLWQRTGLVHITAADMLLQGCHHYLDWKHALVAAGDRRPSVQDDMRVLEADAGRYIGFMRMVARRESELA